ncbi:MAG: hypothetical protein ACOYNC_02130 [Bacteroidales bacterium]
MAYSLSVSAKISDDHKVRIEPAWWDRDELKKAYTFEEVWANGCYLDYILNVDKRTFIDIVTSQEKHRQEGVFKYEGWIETNDLTKAEIENLIENMPENEVVEILIFEWESGLG